MGFANFFQQTTIIKKKNRKYHTVRTSPKFNSKIVEKAKIHDRALVWHGTGTSLKIHTYKITIVSKLNDTV